MKIIKPGKHPDTAIWTGTCKWCGAIIEATSGELDVHCGPREGNVFAWSNCPDCESFNTVYFLPAKE